MTIAFIKVNLLPMDFEHVLFDQTVVVQADQIVAIGPADQVAVPDDAQRISGDGRFLLPGFADMHVHLEEKEDLILYLLHGITTVRNMAGSPLQLAWREKTASGELVGPDIRTCGPVLDGRPPEARYPVLVETAEDAAQAVEDQQSLGFDFIKIYDNLSRDAFDAVIQAAAQYGLPVAGHVSRLVRLRRALAAPMASIEHLSGYIDPIESEGSPFRGKWDWRKTQHAVDIDEERIARVAAATAEAGTWNCPTLNVFQQAIKSGEEIERSLSYPEIRYTRWAGLASWEPSQNPLLENVKTSTQIAASKGGRVREKLVKALRTAGAGILLGTDSPTHLSLPGSSFLEEIQCLLQSGLSMFETLACATREPARFLKCLRSQGTIEIGKRASLVLLAGNPLIGLMHLAQPLGVVIRGRWYSREELIQMLKSNSA